MSQEDILRVLKKKDKASADEIAEVLEISFNAVRKSLNRLLKTNEVKKIILTKAEVDKLGTRFCGKHFLWTIHFEHDE